MPESSEWGQLECVTSVSCRWKSCSACGQLHAAAARQLPALPVRGALGSPRSAAACAPTCPPGRAGRWGDEHRSAMRIPDSTPVCLEASTQQATACSVWGAAKPVRTLFNYPSLTCTWKPTGIQPCTNLVRAFLPDFQVLNTHAAGAVHRHLRRSRGRQAVLRGTQRACWRGAAAAHLAPGAHLRDTKWKPITGRVPGKAWLDPGRELSGRKDPFDRRRRTWKLMLSGGRLQGLRSRVVAMSSTDAVSVCSASPANFLSFHTRAWRLGSYLALPAGGAAHAQKNKSSSMRKPEPSNLLAMTAHARERPCARDGVRPPAVRLNEARAVWSGTGTSTTTLVAKIFCGKVLLTCKSANWRGRPWAEQ